LSGDTELPPGHWDLFAQFVSARFVPLQKRKNAGDSFVKNRRPLANQETMDVDARGAGQM
jgi:hypothetical protein